jgi:hypothetical protein
MASSEKNDTENGSTTTTTTITTTTENVLGQQLKELQEKYDLQSEQLKVALKRIKEVEEKTKEQGAFTVTDVIDAKKEIIRLQQNNHELHAQISQLDMESGQRKDELEDAKLSVEDLKSQLRELNIELDESRLSLTKAKQMAAMFEATSNEAEGKLSKAVKELADQASELVRMTEMYMAVEKEAKQIKQHKAMMRDKDRTINRLQRQLRLVSESGNRRLNSTQNSLQSNQQLLSELRDEYEEFYAITEQEWKQERELKDQEYERLEKAHTRLLSIQFEDKQHMMREHQEIIKALQTQFQEYRRTAEVLFKTEASKLEGRLHLQMEEYEEELNYVITMKDKVFDEMIACKDAKILTLIEGTDFQQLLIRHELEKEQMRRKAVEDINTARREWSIYQQKHDAIMQNKHVEQESQIKTLQAQINESNDKLHNLINRVSQDSQKIREIEDRHKDALKHKQDQLEKILKEKETMAQEKFNLRHRLIFYKSKAGGSADESVNSVVIRMQKEMKDISEKFTNLLAKYDDKVNEKVMLEKQTNILQEKLKKATKRLDIKTSDMEKLKATFEKHLGKKATMSTVAMSPKYGSSVRARYGMITKVKNDSTNDGTNSPRRGGYNYAPPINANNNRKVPTVPEITLVSGISPYVRREQEKQAKNRKARFEEHMKRMEQENKRKVEQRE